MVTGAADWVAGPTWVGLRPAIREESAPRVSVSFGRNPWTDFAISPCATTSLIWRWAQLTGCLPVAACGCAAAGAASTAKTTVVARMRLIPQSISSAGGDGFNAGRG